MVCCPLQKNLSTPIDHKSIQLHLKSQAVTNVAMFQDNIAAIVSISLLSQLCIENLLQLWKESGYCHLIPLTTNPSSIVFKNRVVANVTIFSYDKAMILNMSQLSQVQYQNCDNCKIALWCATVFHNCHSLVVRSEARIVENWMKCHNFVQNRY